MTWEFEPAGGTVNSGFQTLSCPDNSKFVTALSPFIKDKIEDFIVKTDLASFIGSFDCNFALLFWVTKLNSGGYQAPHYHPSGIISGVYYINLPNEIDVSEGCIEFGVGLDFIQNLSESSAIKITPKEGRLILFPSYLYHRTTPFFCNKSQNRIALAFDLVPIKKNV